jgi:RHS repeat-associated protein
MRWVLMLFVILAALMGGEARAVVVMGRVVVSERVGRAETVEKRAEALRVESERAFLGAALEVQKAAGLMNDGPLMCWFPGGAAVARSDCGDRQAVFSDGTLSLLLARGVDIGGGTRGLLWTARRETGSAETGSTVTLRFNRYNSRGDVVGQSDAAGVTTWAATYQADGRRTGEIGTNLNPKHATGRVRELGVNRDRQRANTKEEDPTGLLNEGFRYRDMETGTFISRDPLGHVDGPNVYCYVRQNPWTKWDPEGLFVGALVKRINEHIIRPAAESFVGAVIDALPQSAVEQLSNSRGFESAMEAGRTVSGGIMHGSQEALGMLSPMDGAADKLLKGDLGGAGNEAMLEAFGGRVFKAAGKGIAAVKRHAGKLDEAVGALSHADDAATATATGVRESIEEASSVLAKEGGGVAKTTPTSLWSKAEFNGTRVYQRNDLIDAALVDARGRTNLQRMQSGLAPIGPDGKSLNLHHTIHSADGPLAEMTATFHQQNSRVIHINPNTIPSGIDRRAFDAFRRDYWMNRANGFSP